MAINSSSKQHNEVALKKSEKSVHLSSQNARTYVTQPYKSFNCTKLKGSTRLKTDLRNTPNAKVKFGVIMCTSNEEKWGPSLNSSKVLPRRMVPWCLRTKWKKKYFNSYSVYKLVLKWAKWCASGRISSLYSSPWAFGWKLIFTGETPTMLTAVTISELCSYVKTRLGTSFKNRLYHNKTMRMWSMLRISLNINSNPKGNNLQSLENPFLWGHRSA